MRACRAALVAVALLAACGRGADNRADRAERGADDRVEPAERGAASAPAGPLPRVVETNVSQMSGAWGRGFRIRYETALDITDVPALRHEADSIWAAGLRDAAEAVNACTVELKASTPTRTTAVPGTGGGVATMRRNWSFVLRHDSAGAWRWLTATDVPLGPCPTSPRA